MSIVGPASSLHHFYSCLIAVMALAAGPAVARSHACSEPEYRQLDFWLGSWRAYDDDGKGAEVARDQVTAILGGCVILERYRQNDGHEGEGVTIYDASRRLWHQTWVTNSGELLTLEGRFQDGALTMRGNNLDKDAKPVWYRATWTRQRTGVRETAFISKDGGRSWRPDFDILFARIRQTSDP